MFNLKLINRVGLMDFDNAVTQISADLEVSKGSVSSYLNGKIKASKNFLEKFANYYKVEIDDITDSKHENANNIEVTHLDGLRSSIMQVPLVNQYAYGGYLSGYDDNGFLESLPKIPYVLDKEYKGQYLCFEVRGDSMEVDSEESIPEGSILLCRNVRQDYWKSKLHINKWDFVIVHIDGILVKRIIKHDVDKGIITIHSLNDFYEDKEINLRDVKQIFNIVEIQLKRKRR